MAPVEEVIDNPGVEVYDPPEVPNKVTLATPVLQYGLPA